MNLYGTGENGSLQAGDTIITIRDTVGDTGQRLITPTGQEFSVEHFPDLAIAFALTEGTGFLPDLSQTGLDYKVVMESIDNAGTTPEELNPVTFVPWNAPVQSTWKPLPKMSGLVRTCAVSHNGYVIMVPYNGNEIHVSRDGGQTWEDIGANLNISSGQPWASALSNDGQSMFVGLQSGDACVSHDGGETWSVTNVSTLGVSSNKNIYTASMSADGQTIVFGTRDSRCFLSKDGGATWNLCVDSSTWVLASCMSDDGQKIYLGRYNNAYYHYSHDGGITWSTANCGNSLSWIACDATGDIVVVNKLPNSSDKPRISRNGGSSWADIANSVSYDHRTVIVTRDGLHAVVGGGSGNVNTYHADLTTNAFTSLGAGFGLAGNYPTGSKRSIRCMATGGGTIVAGMADGYMAISTPLW